MVDRADIGSVERADHVGTVVDELAGVVAAGKRWIVAAAGAADPSRSSIDRLTIVVASGRAPSMATPSAGFTDAASSSAPGERPGRHVAAETWVAPIAVRAVDGGRGRPTPFETRRERPARRSAALLWTRW